MLLKKLRACYHLIIKRRTPYSLFCLSFFRPKQSAAAKIHRFVFFNAWDQLPRWGWAITWSYLFLKWVGWHSWRQIYHCFRRLSRKTRDNFNISFPRQLIELVRLALCYCVPPIYYYLFGLFRPGCENVFDYIFSHELPHFHRAMCKKGAYEKSCLLLQDKKSFAEQLSALGLPTIQTYAYYEAGEKISPKTFLTSGEHFFFKPNMGHEKLGCFEASFDSISKDFYLRGEVQLCGKQAVLDYINEKITQKAYLVQPLLKNHPEIQSLCKPSGLVTVRMVVAHNGSHPILVSAILVIPLEKGRWELWGLDCMNGVVLQEPTYHAVLFPANNKSKRVKLTGARLPFWDQLVHCSYQAHNQFPNVVAIGWDLGITDKGVVLIEGNFNWAVDYEQIYSNTPLLQTALLGIYQDMTACGSNISKSR